ncbi:hypothetical protein P12x_002502 [Tundrisphaera lichenicola]|uniref:hypothetical protein n=1 Tax=Tundrisphaera lichenicola TaxID=2029860 RepID=UPI003EBDB2A3
MGLAESQRLLARLAVDAPLRARFRADPAAVADEFGLGPQEARTIAELPIAQIDGFAASLIAKRRGEVELLLPLTLRAVGPARFAALFRSHAATFVPSGIKKHRDDALAFAGLLAREVDKPWMADLLRFEASTLRAHDPSRRWTLIRLHHHPIDLARAATEGGEPRRRWTILAWFRRSPRGRLRRVILALPG